MLIASDKSYAIVGLGITGLSVARYLSERGVSYQIFDEDTENKNLDKLRSFDSKVTVHLGAIAGDALIDFYAVILSPGVPRASSFIQSAASNGAIILNDVSLFLQQTSVPVIGITGSNGKTTVATLVGQLLERSGLRAVVAGNIGRPVLDALKDEADIYVLELSSFQLESMTTPALQLACLLNISDDHMDRYTSLADYCFTKQKIFHGASSVIYNLDDKLTVPPKVQGIRRYGFSIQRKVEENEQHIYLDDERKTIFCEGEPAVDIRELPISTEHHLQNAMAVVAAAKAINLDFEFVQEVLSNFSGLAHRCELVDERDGVVWVNDSKATNTGAAMAAILGFAPQFSQIHLIAGGDGKGADFSGFAKTIVKYITHLYLIGQDANLIAQNVLELDINFSIVYCDTLEQAVEKSNPLFSKERVGKERVLVLLSPACASMDMFSNYMQRGEVFRQSVVAELGRFA